jgi:hypothetical protein
LWGVGGGVGGGGGAPGPGDSLYKVSYKSKYGSKALDQVIWSGGDDGWGYLAPSPYIKGQMEAFYDQQNTQVCYRKPYYPLTNGSILYDRQNTQVCYKKQPYDPTYTHPHALVDSGIRMKDMIT